MALPPDGYKLAGDEVFLSALWRNVYITVFEGDMTVARLRKIGAAQKEAARRLPKGFVALALIRATNLNMPADVRAEGERLSKDIPAELQAIAQVIHGTGFKAAAVRSAATGMQLLSRQTRPKKVFDSLEPAIAWLVPRMNELPEPEGPVAASNMLQALRSIIADSASVMGSSGDEPW